MDRTVALVEDLLLTDAFLIKGRIEGKATRLSKMLDRYERRFLVVSDATMRDLDAGRLIQSPKLHVNVGELILAHELVETSGDYYQKVLAEGRAKPVRVRAFIHGRVNLELAGRIRPGAYEEGSFERRFFVMEDCRVRGLNPQAGPEVAGLAHLSYAIVNKDRIAYLYDFS